MLDSLSILDPRRFYIVVIAAVTSQEVSAEAGAKVRAITEEHPDLSILVVDQSLLDQIRERVNEEGAAELLGLAGYPLIRNLQLLIPLAVGTTANVALDDDELVTDPAFLDKAAGALGHTLYDMTVDGLSGYYKSPGGDIKLATPAGSLTVANLFDRKAAIMNEATDRLEAMPGDIVPTPFCYGGNQIFSTELASTVCFDPAITRGEDIDYLINAWLAGRRFFMNKELSILHEPRPGLYQDVAYHKVVQDVLRFVYERAKIRAWREIGAAEEVTAERSGSVPWRLSSRRSRIQCQAGHREDSGCHDAPAACGPRRAGITRSVHEDGRGQSRARRGTVSRPSGLVGATDETGDHGCGTAGAFASGGLYGRQAGVGMTRINAHDVSRGIRMLLTGLGPAPA